VRSGTAGSFDREGVILRPDRQPSHPSFEWAQCAQGSRKEDPITDLRPAEACRFDALAHGARRDEARIYVERTGADGVCGQRIIGIVFEYERSAPWRQHSMEFPKQRYVLTMVDMVENASGKRDIEARVGKRNLGAVEMHESGLV